VQRNKKIKKISITKCSDFLVHLGFHKSERDAVDKIGWIDRIMKVRLLVLMGEIGVFMGN